jgi:hypothetical protein
MGMYDTIRSSYNLGEEFTDVELQTKDIDSCLDFYWIDPSGKLWVIDTRRTVDLKETGKPFPIFNWVTNGNHGKVKRVYITEYINVYRNHLKLCKIHFKNGVLQDFEIMDRKQF